jgi:hypothetical protein
VGRRLEAVREERMRLAWIVMVAVLALFAGCGDDEKGSDSAGCTPANCEAMRECKVGFMSEPSLVCRAAPGRPEQTDQSWCVRACEEKGVGRALSCYAEKAPLCAAANENPMAPDFGALDEVRAACVGTKGAGGAGEPDWACLDACEETFETCGAACPQASWDACAPCAYDCGTALERCAASCN